MSQIFSYILSKSSWLSRFKARLSESPIAYRLARGAFWSLIGGVGSRALTLVSSIIVARLLGKEGYGEVGMVQSTIGLFGVFAGFGLGSTATKYIAEYRIKDPEKAGRILNLTLVISLISGGIMAIACLVISPWLAERTLNRSDLASVLAAGSLLLFISTLGGVQSAALSGFESFRAIARITIWQGAAAPLVAIPCVWFYGVQGAIASFTINAAIGLILCTIALKSECKNFHISQKFDTSFWSERFTIWKFALPSMFSGLMMLPTIWITNTILVNQPGGYSELGLFNAANQWRMVIIFLPGLLAAAILPVLSETHGREDKSDFRKTVVLNFRATWIVAFPLTVMIIAFSKPLGALFGKQFLGTSMIISILMVAVFLNLVNATIGAALIGAGRIWIGTAMNLCWAIVLILSSVVLVPLFGGFGLALSYLISYLFHTVWQMAYLEIKLASTSIVSQWKLIMFTLLILSLSVWVSFSADGFLLVQVLLVSVSLFPLLRILQKYYYLLKGPLAAR
jgi:O-antigen/teichoic acid export membrane protein